MANRIDATSQSMEPPARQSTLDGLAADAQFDQLPPRHYSVLLRGNSSDLPIR